MEGLTLNIELKIDDQNIECVTKFTFLGLYLDNKLEFDTHYYNLYKKLF